MRWRKLKKQINSKVSLEDSTKNSDFVPLATFWDRAKAQVIDTFMIYIPILYFLTYVVVGSAKGFRDSTWAPLAAVAIYALIAGILLAFKGQTPGKKAYDLWIMRDNGKKVTLFYALFRFFCFLLSGVSVVGILSPLWRKDKKALHDFLSRSQVIKKG